MERILATFPDEPDDLSPSRGGLRTWFDARTAQAQFLPPLAALNRIETDGDGQTRNLAAGNYVARSFTLNGNSTLTVSDGIVQIWVTGALSIGGKANNGGVPENLEFFLTSASGANINGGAAVSALLYGPTTPVIVSAPVHGSVIGSRTTLNSGGQVVFDPNSTCPTAE